MRAIFYTASERPDEKQPSTALMLAALSLADVEVKVLAKSGSKLGESNAQILARWREELADYRPDLWMTHCLAVDGTDDLDLRLSRALGIPYVLIEPQFGRERIDPIEVRNHVFRQALDSADVIMTTRSVVATTLKTLLSEPERVTRLLPFVDTGPLVAASRIRERHKAAMASHLRLPLTVPWLLAKGPMESGDALQSYRMLAQAFSRFPFLQWVLVVVGEGEAQWEVRRILNGLPRQRVRLWSAVSPEDMTALWVACDLFVWPALGDVGLQTLLEAQAAGLGVVACNSPEVNERVLDGITGRLADRGNGESFANLVSFLLRQPAFRTTYGKQARDLAIADFDIHRVVPVLRRILQALKRE